MIRHLFLTFACASALLAAMAAGSAARAGIQDFTVVNQGSNAIWYIFVSPKYSDSWEEDVLGEDVLMPGKQVSVYLNSYGSHCYFDIKIQDSNGYAEEYYDVDLCNVRTVYFPANAPKTKSRGEQITVVNNGSTQVWYIFVSPNYSDNWEEDVLGVDVLIPGMQFLVPLASYNGHCFFDVKVEDSNGYAREYYDVNACNSDFVHFP
ncbi:MAG: hypothetical protein O3B22_08710 [Proteobacteria bacterium]|nr:hypothetical protein [Pseudomonadota bacterium]